MSREVLYVSGGSELSKLFARALRPLGYDELVYFSEFWRALKVMDDRPFGLIILHGPLPALTIDDGLVDKLRELSQAPVFLLDWDEEDDAASYEGFELVPSPVTAAALAQAVARFRKPREENALFDRLLKSPGFQTFTEAAMIHLLGSASAVQLQDEEELFEEGAAGDAMFFVLAGAISLRLGDQEVERCEAGGMFGEMGMLEAEPREAKAVSDGTSVLLQVRADTLQAANQEFRSIFFELVTRVLVRRLRSTNVMLRAR